MMKHNKAITRSIVGLKKQLRLAVRELNQEAATLVTRGRYESSTALVEMAKRTTEFVSEVEILRKRWKEVRSGGAKSGGGEKTPLWEYYKLVAQALAGLGGEAKRSEIVEWDSKFGLDQLKPGDLARTAQGKLIWERNVGRAKRAMLKEQYLEPGSGLKWKLSRLGQDLSQGKESK